jgi:mono/diheme cytochrome c family protein
MKYIVTGLVVVIVACVTPLRSYAGNEAQDPRVQKGKVWYEQYCTPCHGVGGTPGSAVFPGTKKRIDLRTYQQRNGGTFPSWRWWDVTFNPQPGAAHTDVWERIRDDQTGAVDRDITARGVVSYIEQYVRSIQEKSK